LNSVRNDRKTIPVRFFKILITGPGSAGKTSFSNLLMKQINRFHHSDNVVQSKHAISIRKAVLVESKHTHNLDTVWLEMDDNAQIAYLRQVLLSSNNPKQHQLHPQTIPQQAKHTESKVTYYSMASTIDADKYTTSRSRSIAHQFAGIFGSSVKGEKLASFDALVENFSINTDTNNATTLIHHPGKVLNIITIIDTCGQPEYTHLLPIVNIHPVVTFIVHDLSKSLDDQVLVEYSEHGKHIFKPQLGYSYTDIIKFLMSSVNDASTSQVPQLVTVPGKCTTSYLCFVGSHADKVGWNTVGRIDSKLRCMVEMVDCKAAVWQNKDGGVLFPIDNTTAGREDAEDPIAAFIRSKIEMLFVDRDVYELPITWMLLEIEIREVCNRRQKPYISFQECVSIASQSKLITDVEQVRGVLLYHHLLGVLLYYPEVPGLCDYIIIDHQWLFDSLNQIVHNTLKPSFSGVLSKELLRELNWEGELKQEYFISLLVEMKIIAPLRREDGDGEDYFILHVLPTYTRQSTGDDILSQYGYLQGEPLLIKFVSNLLPRGFFCYLIAQILQCLPKDWYCFTKFSNLVTFILPQSYFLSLLDRWSYLEVQIRHVTLQYHQIHPVHLRVLDMLACAIDNVCNQLNFNHGKLQYGFHCQCGMLHDEHIAILTTLFPPFDYAQCTYGSVRYTKLQFSHLVWFTEVI